MFGKMLISLNIHGGKKKLCTKMMVRLQYKFAINGISHCKIEATKAKGKPLSKMYPTNSK